MQGNLLLLFSISLPFPIQDIRGTQGSLCYSEQVLQPVSYTHLDVYKRQLLFSIVGMAGSYTVAWFGIRVNTYANARTAFASLKGRPLDVVNIPSVSYTHLLV